MPLYKKKACFRNAGLNSFIVRLLLLLIISNLYFQIKLAAKWEVQDDNGKDIFCFVIPLEISGWFSHLFIFLLRKIYYVINVLRSQKCFLLPSIKQLRRFIAKYEHVYDSLGKLSRRQTEYIFSYFSQEIGFVIPCKLSPGETICMKNRLFCRKKKNEKIFPNIVYCVFFLPEC